MNRVRGQFSRTLVKCFLAVASVGWAMSSQAQSGPTCPATPPPTDVLVFVDNSGSIDNDEFDSAQQAIAGIANSVLSRPGYRMAAVNWACTGADNAKNGCRIDLATGSAIAGGWSTNPADFAYAGYNSASNRVCRSFGGNTQRSNCGQANFTGFINDDYAQHALKMLEAALYSGGGTGGNDAYNAATAAPSAPTQRLMIIHLTDGGAAVGSRIADVPNSESALGRYYYSNYLKNQRNALIVGVGIDYTTSTAAARQELGAVASKGGSSTDYDTTHTSAASTQAYDTGTPRLATFANRYDATQILNAANSALAETVPACAIVRKQSVGGTGSFSFTGGTNGLPSSLTLTTTAVSTPVSSDAYTLTNFNTNASIQETIPAGWEMSSVACVNASNASVPVTTNLTTGQITLPASQITTGAQLTCTVTNTRTSADFGTCDARMYLDRVNTSPSPMVSTLYDVGYATAPFSYTTLGSGLARNGVAFNPLDNYIYGIEWDQYSGNELIRVGTNGSSTNLGVISGLPSANYNNGVITPTGEYYVIPSGTGTTMYRINIATRVATAVTLSQSVNNLFDLAWHNNRMYGVSSGTLVSITTTGAVTSIGTTPNLNLVPSMWGFTNGLYGSTSTSSIYAIDPATGATTFMSSAPDTSNSDGANCPTAAIQFNADLSITKTNTPASGPNDLPNDTYVPGASRTYTIVVRNSGPFGAHDVTVSDPLPAGITTASWTCSGTGGGGCTASGSGAINDTAVRLPPSATVTYLLTMTVPADYTGDLTNTATVTPGPATSDTNMSNNTATDVDQAATVDLAVTKSASPTTAVSGDVVSYTIVASNNGPIDLTNARLSDTPSAGLDCTVPSSTATCAATGTATCPSATVPVSTLLGSGIIIPSLPVGQQVTVTLQCRVTASGL